MLQIKTCLPFLSGD